MWINAAKLNNQDGITAKIIRIPIIKKVNGSPVDIESAIFIKIQRPIKNKPQANNKKA